MRKSVSVAFFSLMSTLLIFGTVIMGGSELVLFSNYFAQERYDVLDEVVNVAQRTASHLVQEAALPEGEELEALNTKLELIGESAEVYLFFTDCDGNVVLASDPENLAGDVVEASVLEKSAKAKENYHVFGTLDGVLTEKSYISVREMRRESGECTGYLFLCSSGDRLVEFRREFFSNFFLSACLMLLVASVLTKVMMHKLTDPIQKVTDAAQRFGGGDLSVRVEGVDGEGEVADLARTFNKMADNIQSNDNSRGQFMGNIAHELRTPMTTIKGFIDGILDGTIPPDMQNHYLQLVSEETGRLARLIQNMLDLSKLESGEYQVNARMFNIWETLTGVALSAEQRINDGMIEVAYNLLDNAIKFTPAGGTIRFGVERLGPEVEVSIWNSGQGISPEALPYVFQRFYKEDQSRGLHARGAGLGLNICKVLVNLSGGQIRVESKQGEWCRFVFTLPVQPPNPGGMKRLPDESGRPGAVEDPASMKPVD
ncbi:MAG: HAMP domain-containing protein [Faecalibacterium prausnitzii]|uniref:histidine kinase n=1 Tax=Faecalibacterium prausnitzii TaxID=853 RepID=A0A943IQG2_9FIRM|nr:HAMP domain-containing protein [Faecalibacterium prausnitzii]